MEGDEEEARGLLLPWERGALRATVLAPVGALGAGAGRAAGAGGGWVWEEGLVVSGAERLRRMAGDGLRSCLCYTPRVGLQPPRPPQTLLPPSPLCPACRAHSRRRFSPNPHTRTDAHTFTHTHRLVPPFIYLSVPGPSKDRETDEGER